MPWRGWAKEEARSGGGGDARLYKARRWIRGTPGRTHNLAVLRGMAAAGLANGDEAGKLHRLFKARRRKGRNPTRRTGLGAPRFRAAGGLAKGRRESGLASTKTRRSQENPSAQPNLGFYYGSMARRAGEKDERESRSLYKARQ